MSCVNHMGYLNDMSYVNNMSYVSDISYLSYMGYISYTSYVNNMSYVKEYELRHEVCKFCEYFYESLKIKLYFSLYIRINLRHQKYKIWIHSTVFHLTLLYIKNYKKCLVSFYILYTKKYDLCITNICYFFP